MRTSAAFDLDPLIKDPAVNLELKGTAADPHNVLQHLDVDQDVEHLGLLQHALNNLEHACWIALLGQLHQETHRINDFSSNSPINKMLLKGLVKGTADPQYLNWTLEILHARPPL